jgi:predicted hotdog family 3-hydroxylacyl-ACP dehydratase
VTVVWTLEDVLPHRPPFILLDNIESWNEKEIVSTVIIGDASPFLAEKGVPAFVGLEYMAQTCGAWAGCRAQTKGEDVSVGFLLGSRDYIATRHFFLRGEVLKVKAELDFLDGGLGSFKCSIRDVDALLATATVVVYQPNDLTEFS